MSCEEGIKSAGNSHHMAVDIKLEGQALSPGWVIGADWLISLNLHFFSSKWEKTLSCKVEDQMI